MVILADFREYKCPKDAALVLTDPPYGLDKKYGNKTEDRTFDQWVHSILDWSSAPWTMIFGPMTTMHEWLHKIQTPDRILWWCKTFAQIRLKTTWQHAVTPILVYSKEDAPWYYPRGIVPDWINCASSMGDIRLTKHHFRGVHPGITGTAIAQELILPVTKQGDLVVDPMSGIGSIPVAAKRLARRYLGYEIVPEYAEAANKWLNAK